MRTLPTEMIRVLAPFAPLFSERVFEHVRVLLAGAILAPGRRTVSSALHAMGLDQHKQFHRYHRVLSRAVWSSREASRVLLGLLVEAFVPDGPLVVGIDETLERRQGKRITAKGIYRDPVRSSHSHFVKTSALRWVCVTLLAEVSWASRVWALPFLCALAYSERYAREQGLRHKPLTEWAWQMLLQLRRWQPQREIIAVADAGYASLKLLDRCRRRFSKPITFITRLRLDAALYEPAPPASRDKWEDLASKASGLRTSRRWPKTQRRLGGRLRLPVGTVRGSAPSMSSPRPPSGTAQAYLPYLCAGC